MKRIVIISGSPGVGKSTIAKLLAENSPYERAMHFHTDDHYGYILKGYIEPWLPEASKQNTTIIEAFVASIKELAIGGYEVIVDGVIGPWFLEPWLELLHDDIDVRYVILRPELEMTIFRNANREKQIMHDAIVGMWKEFVDLDEYESYALDTTSQSPEETATLIRRMLEEGHFRMKPSAGQYE